MNRALHGFPLYFASPSSECWFPHLFDRVLGSLSKSTQEGHRRIYGKEWKFAQHEEAVQDAGRQSGRLAIRQL